jgi:hypothetical protein
LLGEQIDLAQQLADAGIEDVFKRLDKEIHLCECKLFKDFHTVLRLVLLLVDVFQRIFDSAHILGDALQVLVGVNHVVDEAQRQFATFSSVRRISSSSRPVTWPRLLIPVAKVCMNIARLATATGE